MVIEEYRAKGEFEMKVAGSWEGRCENEDTCERDDVLNAMNEVHGSSAEILRRTRGKKSFKE